MCFVRSYIHNKTTSNFILNDDKNVNKIGLKIYNIFIPVSILMVFVKVSCNKSIISSLKFNKLSFKY